MSVNGSEPRPPSDQADPQIAEILIQLKQHPGWAILMAQLKSDAEQAKEDLATVDLRQNLEGAESLQREIHRYYWFEQSIDQIIQAGLDPEQVAEMDYEEEAEYDG